LLDSSSWLFNKSKIGNNHGGFRSSSTKSCVQGRHYPINNALRKKWNYCSGRFSFYSFRVFNGYKSRFFVNWSPASLVSLNQNIARLNMVLRNGFSLIPIQIHSGLK
jgi:hypothetical protein